MGVLQVAPQSGREEGRQEGRGPSKGWAKRSLKEQSPSGHQALG